MSIHCLLKMCRFEHPIILMTTILLPLRRRKRFNGGSLCESLLAHKISSQALYWEFTDTKYNFELLSTDVLGDSSAWKFGFLFFSFLMHVLFSFLFSSFYAIGAAWLCWNLSTGWLESHLMIILHHCTEHKQHISSPSLNEKFFFPPPVFAFTSQPGSLPLCFYFSEKLLKVVRIFVLLDRL